MPALLAMTSADGATDPVTAAAATLARTLGLPLRVVELNADAANASAAALQQVQDPEVALAVLPQLRGDRAAVITEMIQRCSKPLVLVPLQGRAVSSDLIRRVLVPLDGSTRSAETVAETVALFAATGADIVVLHVFDAGTVPMFWDQPAHAHASWEDEFLARYCNHPDARLELRSGVPGESILEVASSERADLIVLGWTQNLSPGRARALRTALLGARVPLLLLPIPGTGVTGSPTIASETTR